MSTSEECYSVQEYRGGLFTYSCVKGIVSDRYRSSEPPVAAIRGVGGMILVENRFYLSSSRVGLNKALDNFSQMQRAIFASQ